MRKLLAVAFGLAFGPAVAGADDFPAGYLDQWHQWRGPWANGVAPQGNPPIQWDESTNIRWKTDIPGRGSASPIVWGDQVFVVTAVPTDRPAERSAQAGPTGLPGRSVPAPDRYYRFMVISLDKATGRVRWERVATEQVPHEGHQPTHGFASGSPTTDGQRLFAFFGSRGVYSYDLEGDLKWERDLGDMRTRNGFGEGTSPTLYGDKLIVQWDHEGGSFITALSALTGETVWKVDRDEGTAWATPLVVPHNGRPVIVTNATRRTRAYDLATGELLWENGGQTANAIPSPVAAGGVAFAMSGFRGKALFAIPLDARGDLTGTDKVLWKHDRGTPYVPSPLLYEDLLYFLDTNNAVLTVMDIATGQPVIDRERLPGVRDFYASPVGAAGRVYLVDRAGTTLVLKHGRRLEVLATNKLDSPIDASPAIVGEEIFLRGESRVYCVAATSG